MAYKKLSEATFVESVSDEATVLVEENDQIKRVPKRVMGKVKTVNGAEPDENGNVEIEADCDWNRMDNKPFGETVTKYTETITFEYLDGLYAAENPFEMLDNIKKDTTVQIEWDGVEYSSYFFPNGDDNSVRGGNLSIVGSGADTGEPYTFAFHNEKNCQLWVTNNEVTTITVTVKSEEIKTLDSKYLPNTGGGGGAVYIDASKLTDATHVSEVYNAISEMFANNTYKPIFFCGTGLTNNDAGMFRCMQAASVEKCNWDSAINYLLQFPYKYQDRAKCLAFNVTETGIYEQEE